MAYSVYPQERSTASLADLVRYCKANVRYDDHDSIVGASSLLSALANDRHLLVNAINSSIMRTVEGRGDTVALSSHSILLYADMNFRIRANVWRMPEERAGSASHDYSVFSYEYPHNHNFHLLTVGYLGSGYWTELHECRPKEIVGFVGETVSLKFLEKTSLPRGKVMFYRAQEDVHTQLPPEELSVSLNLMVVDSEHPPADQYHFDIKERKIIKVIAGPMFAHNTLMTYAVLLKVHAAVGPLLDLGFGNAHWRGRKAALESAAILDPSAGAKIWRRALQDREFQIRNLAVSKLS